MAKRKAEEAGIAEEPFVLPAEIESEATLIVQKVAEILFAANQSGEGYTTGPEIRQQLGQEFEPMIATVSVSIGAQAKGPGQKAGKGWMKKLLSLEPSIECIAVVGEDQPCYRLADGSPIPTKKTNPNKEARDAAKGAGKTPQKLAKAVGGNSGQDPWTEAQLNKWVEAKRNKDFATADAIRAELRSMGIEPNSLRPRGWELGTGSGAKQTAPQQNTKSQPGMEQMMAMFSAMSEMAGGADMTQMAKMMEMMGKMQSAPSKPISPFGKVGNMQKGAGKGKEKSKDRVEVTELPAHLKQQGEIVIQAAINYMMVNMDESGMVPGGKISHAIQQEQSAAVDACKTALGGKGWLKKLLPTSPNIEVVQPGEAPVGEPCYKLVGF